MRPGGLQVRSRRLGEEKESPSSAGIQTLHPDRNPVSTPTALSRIRNEIPCSIAHNPSNYQLFKIIIIIVITYGCLLSHAFSSWYFS